MAYECSSGHAQHVHAVKCLGAKAHGDGWYEMQACLACHGTPCDCGQIAEVGSYTCWVNLADTGQRMGYISGIGLPHYTTVMPNGAYISAYTLPDAKANLSALYNTLYAEPVDTPRTRAYKQR